MNHIHLAAWSLSALTAVGSANAEAPGDFDGDGRSDIFWRNGLSGENAIWAINGLGLSGSSFITSVADVNWVSLPPVTSTVT